MAKPVWKLLDSYQVGLWCLYAFRTTHNVAAEFPFYPTYPSIPFISSNSSSHLWSGPVFFSLLIWHPFRFDVVFETRLHRLCEVVDRFIEAPICGVDLEGHATRNAKALVGDIEITKSYIKKHDLECCDQKMYILHIFWWFHVISYFVNPRYVMSYICCLVDGWFYAFCNILLGCWLGQVQHVPKSMI